MRFLFTFIMLMVSLSFPAFGTSIFHSYITDLSPPYMCKLKLKDAKGVSIDIKHSYSFSGICSIKLPVGNTWIYQNVWVESVLGTWDGQTNEAIETTTLANNMGTIRAQLRCDDDPWLTKSQCALVGYENNTQFTNLSGVYNPRTGQYPPFEIMTGQYPPLARNQAIIQEAMVLSVINAKREAAQAHIAFNQTFGSPVQQTVTPIVQKEKPKTIRKVFKKPCIGKHRVDVCLRLNKNCGKPAADRFCQVMGFRYARSCKIDSAPCIPTFNLGAQTICTQSFCKGFDEIECVK